MFYDQARDIPTSLFWQISKNVFRKLPKKALTSTYVLRYTVREKENGIDRKS